MSERPRAFPGELQQIKNFLGTKRKLKDVPIKLRGFQTTILRGLLTVIPGEIKSSGILENPQCMTLIGAIGVYQTRLNDRIDFEGSGRTDMSDLIQEARSREGTAREKLNIALLNLPEAESGQVKTDIETAVQEIEFVEGWIRKRRDNDSVGFYDVDRYRNLVNAISNVMVTSVIFGNEKLPHTQKVFNKNTTLEEIEDKYSWVMGTSPLSSAERAVMIMHNVTMAIQIADDWHGRDIDALLHIPSYASAALRMAGGDKKTAKAVLDSKKREYKTKARELGLGAAGTEGMVMLISTFMGTYNFLIKKARHGEWLRNKLNSPFFLREVSYMSGKLDKSRLSK